MKREYNYKPLTSRIWTKTLTLARQMVGRPRKTVDIENFKHIKVEEA